ncbi:Glycoside hydrolase family 17 [Dillenia turbinata]|uniref:Glycoside hydrolase family 17 n=1 Tax=Dillenia turbinata TaxID=194707 RepID=A0AAN8WFZ8_9MAGN
MKSNILDLPTYQAVVGVYNQNGIPRIRLYEADRNMLQALDSAGSNIEVMLGIPNDSIETLATTPADTETWVKDNIINYTSVDFKYIVVGNEVDLATRASVLQNALQNIFQALRKQGRETQIKVTTAIGAELLSDQEFSPPSRGVFKDNVAGSMGNILKFLKEHGYPLLVNVHPFKCYAAKPDADSQYLNFALSKPSGFQIRDKALLYSNLFDAILDSLHAAVENANKGTPFKPGLVISETGWPSAGFGTAASVANARTFISKITKKLEKGTPKHPVPISVYITSLYDEKMKNTNNEWDKNWGVFEIDDKPNFDVNCNLKQSRFDR